MKLLDLGFSETSQNLSSFKQLLFLHFIGGNKGKKNWGIPSFIYLRISYYTSPFQFFDALFLHKISSEPYQNGRTSHSMLGRIVFLYKEALFSPTFLHFLLNWYNSFFISFSHYTLCCRSKELRQFTI